MCIFTCDKFCMCVHLSFKWVKWSVAHFVLHTLRPPSHKSPCTTLLPRTLPIALFPFSPLLRSPELSFIIDQFLHMHINICLWLIGFVLLSSLFLNELETVLNNLGVKIL